MMACLPHRCCCPAARLCRRRLRPVAALSPLWRREQSRDLCASHGATRVPAPSPTLVAAREELVRGLTGLLSQSPAAADRFLSRRARRRHPASQHNRATRSRVGRPAPQGLRHPQRRVARPAGDRHRRQRRHRRALRRVSFPAPAADTAAHRRWTSASAAHAAAHVNHWDNLDRNVERGYAGASLWDWHKLPGLSRPALHRLCPRQRLHRHQWHGAHQRQRQCRQPDAAVSAKGRGAGRRVSSLWHPRLSDRALQRADGDRRAARPPIRSTRDVQRLVAGQGGGDLQSAFPTSAASWSRPTPKASPGRRTTAAPMPTAPTCSPTPSRRMAAS